MSQSVPPASQTKAQILAKFDQKWLDSKVKLHKEKYKGAFPEGLMYWMIASQNKVAVEDIKADSGGAEGEEVSLAALDDMLQDEDVREKWTHVVSGPNGAKFEKPKDQAKYCVQSAAVVDMIHGTTTTDKDKVVLVISDGSGTAKVVAYAKAVDLLTEAKVKVGSVVRFPLLNGQYGHWTKKGGKGEDNEEVLWYKLSLPPFGNVYKLDTPVSSVLKNLDQVVVRPKDACYIDGVITNLDPSTKDICSKCFRWYDDKKAEEHRKCKGAEILEVTSYEGTITTTSGQIYKLIWSADARNGETTVKEPKIKVADDTVRIFGTLTERNSVLVTGFKVIDPSEMQASEDSTDEEVEPSVKTKGGAKRLPKAPKKPAPEEDDEEEEDGDEEEEPVRRKVKIPAFEPEEDDEDEDDEEEEAEASPPPRRRVKSPPAPEEAEEEDEEEEDEAPAPPPRRRVATKAPPEPQDSDEDDEEEDEDDAPAPPLKRRVLPSKGKPVQADDDEDDEDEEPAPRAKPSPKRPAPKDEDEEEEDDEEEAVVAKPLLKLVSKRAKNGAADKVTEFILTALTNFGTPQRTVIIAKGAVKAGLVDCDDPKDVESLKAAFKPHLEAAIESGAVKWADEKRQSVWIAKEA